MELELGEKEETEYEMNFQSQRKLSQEVSWQISSVEEKREAQPSIYTALASCLLHLETV